MKRVITVILAMVLLCSFLVACNKKETVKNDLQTTATEMPSAETVVATTEATTVATTKESTEATGEEPTEEPTEDAVEIAIPPTTEAFADPFETEASVTEGAEEENPTVDFSNDIGDF